ncbi:glycosyltransferase family 39 protein [Nocardia callitridis]|uniref:Glycosyltransferase family 39 protein n=2 Tax=Nocardia callitridis TaxID=648753 RepID=A0ABP9KM76_9NOCA
MPGAVVSDTAGPGTGASDVAVSGAVVRGAVVSDTAGPGTVVSDVAVPGAVVSDMTGPGTGVSDVAVSGAVVRGTVVSDMTGPDMTGPDMTGPGTKKISTALPAFAWWPVCVVVAVTALVLLARAGRYGFFGDELYFLSAGHRLAVSYVDQGPLVPLIARAADLIAPGSTVVLRIPAIVASVVAVVVAAAIARELGGGRAAQTLAALAYASCPFLVTQSATLSTFAFDTTLSAAIVLALVRWTRTRGDRALLAVGVLAALDMQVKLLVPILLAGIALGVLVFGPRAVLRRPALWAAAAVFAAASAPGLLWQAGHGWPQLGMSAVIRAEQRAAMGGALGLPVQLATLVGLLGGLLALYGLWKLLRDGRFQPYRWVLGAVLVQLVFVVVAGGRPYYLAVVLPVVFAVGAVAAADRLSSRWARLGSACVVAVSVAITLTVVLGLPRPLDGLRTPTETQAELSTRMRTFGTTGWPELVDTVEAAYRGLDPDKRARTVIVAQNYWQASAIDRLGADGLPAVYSPNRGFARFATPPDAATIALYVTAGDAEARLRQNFSRLEPIAGLDDPLGFPGITRHVTVWRCERPIRNWAAIWAATTTDVLDPGL